MRGCWRGWGEGWGKAALDYEAVVSDNWFHPRRLSRVYVLTVQTPCTDGITRTFRNIEQRRWP